MTGNMAIAGREKVRTFLGTRPKVRCLVFLTYIKNLSEVNEGKVQILCFWTLCIVLFLYKAPSCFCIEHRPIFISIHNVSETGFCLLFQVKPTQFGPIDRASPYLRTPVPMLVPYGEFASPVTTSIPIGLWC
jgi:hypothetical protein